jgi:phosphoribosylformylglycinamidine synthase
MIRIQVSGSHHATSQAILHGANALGVAGVRECRIARLYFLMRHPGDEAIQRLCDALLVDPVTERATWREIDLDLSLPQRTQREEPAHVDDGEVSNPSSGVFVVEVSFRPGVTDVAGRELRRGMAEIGLLECAAATGTRYELIGDLHADDLRRLARQLLCNETVEHFSLGDITPHFAEDAPANDRVERISLSRLDDADLLWLSKRRLLSLDLTEMAAIQEFYRQAGRDATDVELETLAQTWSEHCVHKTFKAAIDFTWRDAQGNVKERTLIDGLLRQYIRAATEQIAPAWLRSAFVDNAGVIAFDDKYDLAFKVETHNHPSALEPFGGANTGVGGVVRDIIGVSARPIAATNILCFGPQDFPHDRLPPGILHPQRIAAGVTAGIADYGNKLGLPTVNGAVIYDEGYLGNPLVFCGCVGLLPHGRHPTAVQVGDLIVALGGRTGRDGIHGATFSSAELTHETSELAGSAVQIGDPITEKGLIEVIEAARDEGLYHAITDCGAGGFSSAVGEMGSKLGAEVELAHAPLKYAGLAPWEIWLSEAQERMVLAVPSASLERLRSLAGLWDVELSVLGTFTGDGNLRVRYNGQIVAELPMEFLHDGLPRRRMRAEFQERAGEAPALDGLSDYASLLLAMLSHPSVASKEEVVRRYDHEVRGGTLVRPFTGPHMDGPSDAAVLKPLGTWGHERAFALGVGCNPALGKADPYAMAISAIDEAIRNVVAVGADPDSVALLDNFCWGNPTLPDRLGALVRACQGCYDGSLAYRAPFISGKDSLYNEFNGRPIPGTLLISAIAIVPEMERCLTSHLKTVGNLLYLVGETGAELGGSLLHELLGVSGGAAPTMPAEPLTRYRSLHRAIRQGLVCAAHDCSEGGLAVALAEMCLAGRLGAAVELNDLPGLETPSLSTAELLFCESNGRLLVEVSPQNGVAFKETLAGVPHALIGVVAGDGRLRVSRAGLPQLNLPVEELVRRWQRLTSS